MITNLNLQTSIHLLNDFCADEKTFSFRRLTFLRLRGLALQVNAELHELTLIVNSMEDYQYILQEHLTTEKRLYQLLGLHFNEVQIKFGLPGDSIDESIHLETISLRYSESSTGLRDVNSLGTRLRRALNVALQGHTGVLWLHDDDMEHLKTLWKRGRVTQLIEKHGIMHSYDPNGKTVKLWKQSSNEEKHDIITTID